MGGMARAAIIRFTALWVCALLACLSTAYAAEQAAPAAPEDAPAAPEAGPPAKPVVRRIGPQLYQVGAVRLDAKRRTIRCKGHVALSKGGPLELLACTPAGKAYESILTLDVRPMDLQVALLLLGLNPGHNPAYKYPPDTLPAGSKPGDLVRIYVEWAPQPKEGEADGKPTETPPPPAPEKPADAPKEAPPAAPKVPPVRVPAEKLLYNRQADKPLEDSLWVFLGSRVQDGRFGGDLEGSLITTYHDPLGILELAAPMVGENQYDSMDYSVNEKICPPVGTPVELVIEVPHKDETDTEPPAKGGEKKEDADAQDKS